jgi:hypothetical protein
MRYRKITPTALAAVAVALGCLVSGCGGGSSSGAVQDAVTSTTGADGPVGDAKIMTLDAPASVPCNGATSTTVTISYATADAASKQLLVDGLRIDGTDPASASLVVPVHCDQLPHTVVLVAKDAHGGRTVKQTLVTTELGAT